MAVAAQARGCVGASRSRVESVVTIDAVTRQACTRSYWSPATATVAENGSLTISNPTEVSHGVDMGRWPGEVPSCRRGRSRRQDRPLLPRNGRARARSRPPACTRSTARCMDRKPDGHGDGRGELGPSLNDDDDDNGAAVWRRPPAQIRSGRLRAPRSSRPPRRSPLAGQRIVGARSRGGPARRDGARLGRGVERGRGRAPPRPAARETRGARRRDGFGGCAGGARDALGAARGRRALPRSCSTPGAGVRCRAAPPAR